MVDKLRKIRYSIKAFKRNKRLWLEQYSSGSRDASAKGAGWETGARVQIPLAPPSFLWPVGETVNSHAFHACIHGFESRTGHHN